MEEAEVLMAGQDLSMMVGVVEREEEGLVSSMWEVLALLMKVFVTLEVGLEVSCLSAVEVLVWREVFRVYSPYSLAGGCFLMTLRWE